MSFSEFEIVIFKSANKGIILIYYHTEKEGLKMSKEYNEVIVSDIKMPFGSMVVFMVKWAIATIPALIILTTIGSIIFAILSAVFGSFHHGKGI